MKNYFRTPAALAIVALMAACASTPTSTSLLENTRAEYRQIEQNPNVGTYAQLEMKQASDAMREANLSAERRESAEQIDKQAYLARQKIALTQEVVKKKVAEADVAAAAKERDFIRLNQRTNEANQANANAQQAQLAAQMAQQDAARAQAQAEQAQRNTQDAQRAAEAARAKTAEAEARAAQLEAKLDAQLAELAAKKTERGIIITLGDVLFGTDKSSLTPDGMRSAQKLADVLTQNPTRTVLVEGHTDSTGAAAYNQELSSRRAASVRDALMQMGIASQRVSVRGYGADYPAAGNDSAAGRQLNRRVEIVLSDATGVIKQR
ncbi:MAG: flagellar motor protein MotB [Burkholderiales bacterium PBB3]|nr:MAG: flagellar motor protein MotB [Burkholderiales bacterium PBB3]